MTIDAGWPSVDGSSVLPSFSNHFRVTEALRERPDVGRWTSRPPRIGTREPLLVTFDRPFDRHLLNDAVRVVTADGQAVDGKPIVGEHERSWSFIPDEPWTALDVRIAVDDTLEDVAGNNLRELLDREVGRKQETARRNAVI